MEHKKTTKANLENKKNVFFQAGLMLALILVLAAFEWKTYVEKDFRPSNAIPIDPTEIIDITKPEPIKPEPPKPITQNLIETPDDFPEDTVDINIESNKHIFHEYVYEKPELPEDKHSGESDEPFIWAEDMPEFYGGEDALYRFLGKNIQYPKLAKEIGIQGTVYVTFIVEKDGSISNASLIRGIGGGCDEEAMRVVRLMPKWKAGKQRGVPVRVQFNLPIKFILVNQ